ncbi:MAG: methylcobalamin--homocysteine methyltransferase [Hyperthermus sp.]|nr:MAG: methylcobalamin--homocysteine methyltransferase [Hyperthermus sp.]
MKVEKLEAEVLGGYPRSERVRKMLRRVEEKAEASSIDALRSTREETLFLLGVQAGAGLTAIVDPMLDWHDPLRPFVEAWRNTAVDGLIRWFDNNFFYRVPVFIDEPDAKRFVLAPRVREYRHIVPNNLRLKVVVPGPVTFAKLSRNLTGKSVEELAADIASILEREVALAVEAGASVIQVDEPYMADVEASKDDAVLAAELVSRVLSPARGKSATRLAIEYNVPSGEVYERLLDTRVDYIVLDVVDSPGRAMELLKSRGVGGHGLGLGVIQARNIYPDKHSVVVKLVEEAVNVSEAKSVLLTTSAWLDLIPLPHAISKTNILGYIFSRIANAEG